MQEYKLGKLVRMLHAYMDDPMYGILGTIVYVDNLEEKITVLWSNNEIGNYYYWQIPLA